MEGHVVQKSEFKVEYGYSSTRTQQDNIGNMYQNYKGEKLHIVTDIRQHNKFLAYG